MALSVLSLSLGLLSVYVVLLTRFLFLRSVIFCYLCVLCLLAVLVRLSVGLPVQVIDWKDSSPK